ncbi:TraR/DksA family transcriptional regulator [Sphingopyxis sp. A083]|uniref:TraR/DksA family transcriptional regulator n=1 Tax=Sphingopyxis sp. A083 TaxID=1759083 RepID=UPI00073655C6|nr:TraR/DksA C4-type zinc finger protein [Sphingopyxis sp. A083]KTE76032.1 conjugal transfer protein TraR [Sphingopyxis sp. A083]
MSGGDGFAAVRTGLILRLADLRARGARVAADLTAPISADAKDAAIEREDDDALAGEDALLAREVAAVTAAIARIDEGSYGICTSCGKEISAERLAAKPEAALCIECARKLSA